MRNRPNPVNTERRRQGVPLADCERRGRQLQGCTTAPQHCNRTGAAARTANATAPRAWSSASRRRWRQTGALPASMGEHQRRDRSLGAGCQRHDPRRLTHRPSGMTSQNRNANGNLAGCQSAWQSVENRSGHRTKRRRSGIIEFTGNSRWPDRLRRLPERRCVCPVCLRLHQVVFNGLLDPPLSEEAQRCSLLPARYSAS